jgi:undecaprenyl diphosphate synthase
MTRSSRVSGKPPEVLPSEDVPRHVAVIMDGNGRWATGRHLPRVAGHSRGVDAVRAIIEQAARRGVSWLTLFAFSSENWRRPAEEVSMLMRLFVSSLEKEVDALVESGVRLRVVGNLESFEPRLRELIARSEERSARNARLQLTICASYGGRWDIEQAALRLARDCAAGRAEPSEEALAERLALAFAPDPDLLIRTGGERRISNFLLWQLAYSELYFSDVLWPDFRGAQFDEALEWFAQRERRFGKTSAQVHPPLSRGDAAEGPGERAAK